MMLGPQHVGACDILGWVRGRGAAPGKWRVEWGLVHLLLNVHTAGSPSAR